LPKFDGPRGHDISLKLVGHTCKILRYKSSSVHSFRKKYSSRENKHFKSDIAGKLKKSKFKSLVAHQIYKGCSSWIKKAGTSHNATNAEKRFKYEKPKEKTPERIFNTKWYEGRKYSRRENKHFKSDIAGKLKKSKFKTGKRF
jgi:hypothetical protein